jgi:hypothetical protein
VVRRPICVFHRDCGLRGARVLRERALRAVDRPIDLISLSYCVAAVADLTSETLVFPIDSPEQKENYVPLSFRGDESMFRAVVEEAAALASLSLFIGMLAVWVQVLSSH